MNEPSRKEKQTAKKVNYWKWAFISLVGLLVVGMVFLVQMTRPVTPIEEQTEPAVIDRTEDIEIVSGLSKADAEFVINSFLAVEMKDTPFSYQVQIEEDLKLSSDLDLMGLTIPFSLTFEPYATEEGNLQLRAQSVEVASLSLPVSAIMAALANQMELPAFVELNSETQMILVDFGKLRNYYPYGIELEKVDLVNDEIQLKLFVNKDTLKRALDSEANESSSIE